MKNLLMLGGNGFIGKNIIEKYISTDYNIVLLNRKNDILSGTLQNEKLTIVEGDLKDTGLIKEVIIDYKVDTIIHLVSGLIPSSPRAEYYEEIENVIVPSYKLIDFLSATDIKFVFFSSGGTIYGKSNSELKEDHKPKPINYYGLSKLNIEQYIQYKNRTDQLTYLILRPSNAFGRYQPVRSDQGFIANAVNKMLRDEVIEIWGDGKTIRDYIEVQTLVEILDKLLTQDIKNEILNIGTGFGYNLIQILQILEKDLNKKAKVCYKEKRTIDVDKMVLNIDKLKSLIEYHPKPIEESILFNMKSIIIDERKK